MQYDIKTLNYLIFQITHHNKQRVRSPCLDETNDSTIAKGAKVTRHMVAKQFERIKRMLGIQKPPPIL